MLAPIDSPEIAFGRARWAGVVVLSLALSAIAAFDPDPWRLALVGAFVPVALLVRPWWERNPGRARYLPALAFAAQASLVTATGGIHSPVIVVFVATALAAAMALGRRREVLLTLAGPVLLVWTLAGLAMGGLGGELIPRFFDRSLPAGRVAATSTYAALLSAVMLGGSAWALHVRGALERAHREAERWQSAAAEGMRERNREILGLTGVLAHELKNPLTAIEGLSTLLAPKAAAGSRERQQLDVLVSEAKRMGAILEDFLNFSRPIGPLSLQRVDLGWIIGDVAAVHEGLARARAIHLEAETGPPLEIDCEPRKVKQILANLVQNAIDATPAGRAVTLSAQADGDRALLFVDDEGPGLQGTMFEDAFRFGVTTKDSGCGIGLTIARSLAEQHGGRLCLEPRAGGGCRARLELPFHAA